MRRFILPILFLAAISSARGAPAKITVLQAQQLSTALRNLDGHMVVIKQNGQDATIMQPWEFGSGALRMRIANDLSIIDASLALAETARQGIVKEQIKKATERTGEKDLKDLKADWPEATEFQRQYNDLMAAPAAGTQDLSRIKASELRLDKNEIPITVLTALGPILDQDVK